jgi:hypothetical protein
LPINSFFLGWQTELEKVDFELREVCGWITPEAETECPVLATCREGVAQGLPAPHILGSKIVGREGVRPRRRGGNQSDRAGEYKRGGGDFAPSGATLVVAMGAEELFQGIIGPGELWDCITMKEARPVTAGHFAEVG